MLLQSTSTRPPVYQSVTPPVNKLPLFLCPPSLPPGLPSKAATILLQALGLVVMEGTVCFLLTTIGSLGGEIELAPSSHSDQKDMSIGQGGRPGSQVVPTE